MALRKKLDVAQCGSGERAREVTARLRNLPGALDDLVLQSQAGGTTRAQYLLVMRWRQRADWEAMLADAELWRSINSSGQIFKLERASIFTQLE